MSYEELQKRAKALALNQGWTEEEWKNPELRSVTPKEVAVTEEVKEWEGSCICDDPEPENPRHGHRNEAGGFCCPHHGNTCGYCHQYGGQR